MTASFEVTLDEERQIIRQRVVGVLGGGEFSRLDEATRACAERLRNPSEVRILVDMTEAAVATAEARGEMLAALRRPELVRIAVFGSSVFGRVMLRFILTVSGTRNARDFGNADDALKWLTQ